MQPREGRFPGRRVTASTASSPCLSQGVLHVPAVPPRRGVGSLLHELGASPAGTSGLAGAWFDDAWAYVTAHGSGGERDVPGREHWAAA